MILYIQRVKKWFSPKFIAWFKAFFFFFVVYTLLALLLASTLRYTLPFIVGLLIAAISQPLITLSKNKLGLKRSISSWLSPLITIAILLSIIGSLGYLGFRELIGLMRRIPTIEPMSILSSVELWLKNLELPVAIPALDINFLNDNRNTILTALNQALSWAGTAAGWVIGLITRLPSLIMIFFVILFSAFAFTRSYDRLKIYLKSLFSDEAVDSARKTWSDGLSMLGKYVRSYLLIYFLTFLQTYILFMLLGLDFPLVWSILVGFSDIIPVLGPGTIYIPMAIAQIIQGNWQNGLFLLLGWVFITIVRQFVESKVVADSINIHPLMMLAVLFVAFQTANFGIFIYLTFMMVFYNLLKQSGMLHSLFDRPIKRGTKKKMSLPFGLGKIQRQTTDSNLESGTPSSDDNESSANSDKS